MHNSIQDFIDFKCEILSEKPKNFEMAGYDDLDLMFIKAVAISEGVNANTALFERADLNKAKRTFVGKPLKIRFINNEPTGHGFDSKTGTFDELVDNIGFIYDAEGEVINADGTTTSVWGDDMPEDGQYQIVVYMVMWQKYFPEISMKLRQLHSENNLKFSIEAERDFVLTDEGYRKCFNILFNGLCVVKNPAFETTRSLMVAEIIKKGGKQMDFEKLYNDEKAKAEKLTGDLAIAVQSKEVAEKEVDTTKKEVTTLKEEIAEKDGLIKTVSAERDTFKNKVETAEKVQLGETRYNKLAKYGDVAKSKEELAGLVNEDFVNLLAETVENYKPSENAEKDDVLGVHFEKGKEKRDKRKELLDLITGLGK